MDEFNSVVQAVAMADEEVKAVAVGPEELRKFTEALRKYKAGKNSIERRTISAENWWKLRNATEREKNSKTLDGFQAVSGWLHNVIVAKHADAMEAYPEPLIFPREPADRKEAQTLAKILPVVLEQNQFEDIYADCMWQKLKTGTGVYKVYWDADKVNGLGDISIERMDLLNVFWEPGTKDVQKSKYFFHTALVDTEWLEMEYPHLKDRLKSTPFTPAKFVYDDNVDTSSKSVVIDCYYKKRINGKTVLHYCQYVGDDILFSTENEGMENGLYDHGMYPFVFDCLFPIEGSPAGYGFIDLCQNGQEQIDMMQTAFIKNTMAGAVPRFFFRQDGSVNEEELMDLNNPLVHVNGTLGEDSIRAIPYAALSGNYIDMRQFTINELRETSGNTETSNGNTPSGVTAASAIAALQEASGKGSRDATRTSYRAYSDIVGICIELIRQFYDLPRQFRITGELGMDEFVSYSNAGLAMQPTGIAVGGQEMFRLPVFDIKVVAAKKTAYSKMSQNELALQFYNNGFFAPQQVEQALSALQMMDFEGKDEVRQMIARNGTLYQKYTQIAQLAMALTQKYEPERMSQLAAAITGQQAQVPTGTSADKNIDTGEDARVTKARARSREASQVDA